MKNFLSLMMAFVLLTGAAFAAGDVKDKATASTESDLIAQLPASDAVMTVNFKRLLSEVVPQLLAGKPEELNKINTGIEDLKAKSGIDLRQFEQAAAGVNYKSTAGKIELEPIFLMRGSFNPTALVGAAKVALNGKFRQETIGGKTVTIFTLPQTAKPTTQTPAKKDVIGKMFEDFFQGEVAVVNYDANTLAIGKPAQARALLGSTAKTRVSKDFADYIGRNRNAVMNLAGTIPANAFAAFSSGNAQIDNVVGSLKQIYATIDTNGSDASLALAASTATATQAQELAQMLQALQSFGKGILGAKDDPKNKAIARIVETLTITQNANQVQLQAIVPPDVLSVIIR